MTEKSEQRLAKPNMSDTQFKVGLGLLIAWIIPFLYYSHQVYTWALANQPKGYKYTEYKQLWMTAVGGASFLMMKETISFVVTPLYRYLLPKSDDEYVWNRKVAKCVDMTVGLVYFSLSSYWGWYTLRYSKWLPHCLGGLHPQGSVMGAVDAPFPELPPGCACYILFTYGYHAQDFIMHFFIKKDNDWREMLLHHLATLALYPGFMYGGYMGVGVVMAYIHDLAEIPCNLCRLSNNLDFKYLTPFLYVIMLAAWIYTRCVLLPYYIYVCATELYLPEPIKHLENAINLEICFVSVLQVLHYYWLYKFLLIGWRLITKGEQRDLINTIDVTKDEKKVQ